MRIIDKCFIAGHVQEVIKFPKDKLVIGVGYIYDAPTIELNCPHCGEPLIETFHDKDCQKYIIKYGKPSCLHGSMDLDAILEKARPAEALQKYDHHMHVVAVDDLLDIRVFGENGEFTCYECDGKIDLSILEEK